MSDQATSAPIGGQEIEFRDIPNHPGYRAGSDGSIWSCWKPNSVRSDRWKKLKPSLRKEDHRKRYTVKRADGSYRRCYGSHLVLESFVGPCPDGLEACHENGDCTNDSSGNLRWDSHQSNLADKAKHGTQHCGEQINTAKLTADDVLEIRRIGKPLRPLAQRFGVTEALISSILKRKTWKHVA